MVSFDVENIYCSARAASSGDDVVYFRKAQAESHDAECWVLTSDHHHDSAGRFHMAERIPRACLPSIDLSVDAHGTVSRNKHAETVA